MSSTLNRWKYFALSVACAAGMTGFAGSAQARDNSSFNKSEVRNVQQQLKNSGLYKGQIDGIDGPMTHQAIRKFQHQNNLSVNGRLDQQTLDKLGVASGEANRSANRSEEAQENQTGKANAQHEKFSASTVKQVQQQLQQKGLYNGQVDGVMNPQTKAAIRQYQQQNNLKATGRLDQQTLSSLGVNTDTGNNPGNTGMNNNNNQK